MSKFGQEERWAREIVQRTLRRTVEFHDDNTPPGMYNLRIGPRDRPEIAIECVGALDRKFTELWNIGPAKGPWCLAVRGDWDVGVSLNARIRDLRKGLEALLRDLEIRRISGVRADHRHFRSDPQLHRRMQMLEVTDAFAHSIDGTGKVTLSVPGIGGAVDTCGSSVAAWLGQFLREPAQADVRAKLERSGAPARHVFVFAVSHGVPWPVESYLIRAKFLHVPPEPPKWFCCEIPLTAVR